MWRAESDSENLMDKTYILYQKIIIIITNKEQSFS